jgi:hypothetical protein
MRDIFGITVLINTDKADERGREDKKTVNG